MSWRYQRSFRHFRGAEEQVERLEEGSEVINTIHLADIGLRLQPSLRWSLSVSLPYLMAQRSSPIRGADREVIGRSETHAGAIGDITFMARRWMFDPVNFQGGNISLGLGAKLPTGPPNVLDARQRLVDGEIVSSVEPVDQSIQPGDGGFGAVVEAAAYRRIAGSAVALYASGSYLINPEATSGVLTYRGAANEAVMSIADQYVARVGASFAIPGTGGMSASLGGRIEGVPAEDLIGSSKGFRRPGYAISIEPGLAYSAGRHSFSLAVPVALERNRTMSVPDIEDGRHGDAAFADYLILVGYWQRF